MKRLLASLLAFAMCFSLSSSAFATDVPTIQPPTSIVWDGPEAPGIEPFENATYWYKNDTIWNGRATNSFYYRLDDEFQFAKIWVYNSSGGPITFSSSYSGGEFGDPHTLEDGEDTIVYVKGNGITGAFYVNITADNGDTLDGLISIRTGTKTGVGYPW